MRNREFRRVKMQASAFVEEATRWAKVLVKDECRFPGDYKTAMRRVARKIGLSYGVVWDLHYRKPKTIGVEKYAALAQAFADEQARKFQEERQAAYATTPLGKALLRAADFASGEKDEAGE